MKRLSRTMAMGLVIILLFLVSCEEQEETMVVELPKKSAAVIGVTHSGVTSDTTVTKTTVEVIQKGSFWKEERKMITGRVEKLIFNRFSKDVILFQDGVVITCGGAEGFLWRIGGVHRIRKESGYIKEVKIL